MSVFKDYFVGTVKDRYAKFEGRARRSEFWYFTLFYMIIYYALLFISGLLFGGMASAVDIENIGLAALAPMALGLIFALAMFIPNLAVGVRRLHDTNKSGWWLLIAFLPLIGFIVLLVFWCTDSTPGTNQYGPNPKTLGSGGNASEHLIDTLT